MARSRRWSTTPRGAPAAPAASATRGSRQVRGRRPGACATYWESSCMAIRPVLRMGDPRLLEPSQPVERFPAPELDALIADMQDTMKALDGAGLAAPQIGVLLQVVIFGVDSNPRYPDAEPVPHTVLINPILTLVDDDMEEG